ncbi:MAG: cytochrome c oxidase subunit II [Dehalococcoidia bacterium]
MAKHIVSTLVLWAILTAIGETLVMAPLFPTVGSKEAEDFDEIFRTLLIMGIPVFAFVISVLVIAMISFRSKTGEDVAAPSARGGVVPKVWLAATAVLAIVVMIHPGLTGLAKLQRVRDGFGWGHGEAELVVRVTAFQWNWEIDYPEQGIVVSGAAKSMVVPDGTRVKFEVESTDVIHSFWVPAWRMKIDAIPGRTTFVTVDIDKEGAFQDDSAYRIQCAELCGLGHGSMAFPVEVVSKEKFEEWVASQKAAVAKR